MYIVRTQLGGRGGFEIAYYFVQGGRGGPAFAYVRSIKPRYKLKNEIQFKAIVETIVRLGLLSSWLMSLRICSNRIHEKQEKQRKFFVLHFVFHSLVSYVLSLMPAIY